MLVKKEFGQRAEHDGVIRASITFPKPWISQKSIFWRLNDVCHQHGIRCGFNEKENGFELGFESQADHDVVMTEIQSYLEEKAGKYVDPKEHIRQKAEWLLDHYGLRGEQS